MKWGVFVADIRPTVALMYDFDNTLCTKDMQEYSFIPKVNMRPEDFWNESNRRAREKKMDRILFSPLIDLEKILLSAIIQIRGKFHDKKRLYARIQRTDIKGMPRGRECCCCRQTA